MVRRLGSDVVLAEAGGAIAGVVEDDGQCHELLVRAKMMFPVFVAVHAVGVILHAAEDHRAAGAATGRRAKTVRETRRRFGKLIDPRRLGIGIAVTAERQAQIIGDKDQHIVRSVNSVREELRQDQ